MNRSIILVAVLLFITILRVQGKELDSGVNGVDVSDSVDQGTFTCMVGQGYSFTIVRAWQSLCQVDPNAVQTIINAWNAGMSHVDIYLFPSYSCQLSATEQVTQTIQAMSAGGASYGTLWFDIETGGGNSDPSDSMAWLQEGLGAASNLGISTGIYASHYEWGQVMGSLSGFPNLPLWYAAYDGNPGFENFNGFAGWTSPAMKQYAGDSTVCNADVDLNWYPAGMMNKFNTTKK
jgi:hypothetical protein